jgi:hypothetical protein
MISKGQKADGTRAALPMTTISESYGKQGGRGKKKRVSETETLLKPLSDAFLSAARHVKKVRNI